MMIVCSVKSLGFMSSTSSATASNFSAAIWLRRLVLKVLSQSMYRVFRFCRAQLTAHCSAMVDLPVSGSP